MALTWYKAHSLEDDFGVEGLGMDDGLDTNDLEELTGETTEATLCTRGNDPFGILTNCSMPVVLAILSYI